MIKDSGSLNIELLEDSPTLRETEPGSLSRDNIGKLQ